MLSRIDRLEVFFKRCVPHFLCFSDELLDVVFSLRQLLQLKIPEIFYYEVELFSADPNGANILLILSIQARCPTLKLRRIKYMIVV